MTKIKGGFYEEIQGKINPVAVRYFYGPRMEKSKESFPYLTKTMTAHVIMLGETGIIPAAAAGKLLAVMEKWGESIPELDPKLEDLYINFEKLLSELVGEEISGYLPVARSRNDVEAVTRRLELRDSLFMLADSLLHHVDILHRRAAETSDYIFPGYTYRQQAMPITMAHYLLGVAAPLLRDIQRVLQCVDRFDQNPLGAAAMSGTCYAIDRKRTAELLGFSSVLEHTGDAVSSADFLLEPANVALMSLSTLSRLAEDITAWCSNEVGFADLPDDMIDSSTIMPQKRNPVICSTVRAQSRLMAGRYAGIVAACTIEYQASRDMTTAVEDVMELIQIANGMCRISAEYTGTLVLKKEPMQQSLYIGFSNATELADSLVLEGGLPFRLAHKIVGGAISQLFREGKGQPELTWDLLDSYSRDIAGMPLPISAEQVRQAKDFRLGVERRGCQGGTSTAETERMLALQKKEALEFAAQIRKRRDNWEAANHMLHQKARDMAQKAAE